jgi:predicted sulfurtransferase
MKNSWRFIITLVVVMAGVLGIGNAFAASLADVQKESERGGYRLVTSDEMWNMLNREPAATLVVDTRQDWEYAAGHIQGAVNFPMEPTWLANLARRGELEQFLGQDRGKRIIFY